MSVVTTKSRSQVSSKLITASTVQQLFDSCINILLQHFLSRSKHLISSLIFVFITAISFFLFFFYPAKFNLVIVLDDWVLVLLLHLILAHLSRAYMFCMLFYMQRSLKKYISLRNVESNVFSLKKKNFFNKTNMRYLT